MESGRDNRAKEIQAAVADIRAIERREGVTRASLEHIKQRLIRFAPRRALFPASDSPAHGDIREAR